MEVAKRENLEATEVDIDAECTKVAMMTNTELDVIKDRLMKTGQYSVLVFTILVKRPLISWWTTLRLYLIKKMLNKRKTKNKQV